MLAPEDRALLSLILEHGCTYGELAESLQTDQRVVRERTRAAADRLVAAADAPPPEERQRIIDYLLWQQPHSERLQTCSALSHSPRCREWASDLAEALAPLSEVPLPVIPGSNLPMRQPSSTEIVISRTPARVDRRYRLAAVILLAIVARALARSGRSRRQQVPTSITFSPTGATVTVPPSA